MGRAWSRELTAQVAHTNPMVFAPPEQAHYKSSDVEDIAFGTTGLHSSQKGSATVVGSSDKRSRSPQSVRVF